MIAGGGNVPFLFFSKKVKKCIDIVKRGAYDIGVGQTQTRRRGGREVQHV